MRIAAFAAALAVALPLSAWANGEAYTPPQAPGTVAVYRGSSANVPSPIPVHRGSAVRPAFLSERPAAATVATVGGNRIWFVESAAGELTGCRLVRTFTVGVNRVRCTSTAHPAGR